MNSTLKAELLVEGFAEGQVCYLDEPLSFSGGLNSGTGRVTERWHPQFDAILTGKVLVMPSGRGSSSGSAVLAEALRRGTGPCAIVLSERDGLVSAGAIVSNDLYDQNCPVVLVSHEDRVKLVDGKTVRVEASMTSSAIQFL